MILFLHFSRTLVPLCTHTVHNCLTNDIDMLLTKKKKKLKKYEINHAFGQLRQLSTFFYSAPLLHRPCSLNSSKPPARAPMLSTSCTQYKRGLDESFSPSMLLLSFSPPPVLQSCRGSFRGCEMVDALATLPAALSINI